MEMFVISDNVDTLTGLRMVGIPGTLAHTAEDFAAALETALADAGIGILLVVERLAKENREALLDVKLNRTTPLVVEIPDRHGTGRAPDFISAYVREAIGVKL